jgi:hypothetical protein
VADSPKSTKSDSKKLLDTAKARFKLAVDAEFEQRKEELDDVKFRAGDQWPEEIKKDRLAEKKPCLVINRLVQSVHQITNDQRQNRQSMRVNPVNSSASVETAAIFEGLIRHIEQCSAADVAYDNAFESAVIKGRGFLRIVTDFCDAQSFEQDIFIKPIHDSSSVYLDPHYTMPDGSDANWGFVFEDYDKDEFKAQFPGAELTRMEDWSALGNGSEGWLTGNSARVAEYFYKTFKKTTLLLLSNGQVIQKDQLKDGMQLPEGLSVAQERETVLPAIKWAKINGIEILEETDWLGKWIPIIPVHGDEVVVDGKRSFEGIVRHAKDPQRMYNIWASTETETIALAPKAPFIGVAGQFKGYEQQWKNANRKNYPYLEYAPVSINGTPAPPPTRNVYEAPIQAISQARMQSADDLKVTTGIYDASLGNRSNEQSGLAIQRRNAQAQTSNFHFQDNLSRSMRHAGRQLLDLIPKIYDTPRIGRILKEDGSAEMVPLNQPYQEKGEDVQHMLDQGQYDVVMGTGPSYQTKRQEAAATMLDFGKTIPTAMPMIADLVARNMDWPGAQEIAERLKKTLPPQLQDNKDDQQPLPPEVQQQMSQMNQMIQELTKHLHAAQDEIDKKTLELSSKERIALSQVQAQIEIALAKIQTDSATTLLEHQVAEIEARNAQLLQQEQMSQAAQAPPQQAQTPQASPQIAQQPTGGPTPGQPME